MKGNDTFTPSEIQELRNLISQRIYANRAKQKSIRARMRKIGFYGLDDYGIRDLQPSDFERLINSNRIKMKGDNYPVNDSYVNKGQLRGRDSLMKSGYSGEFDFVKFDPKIDSSFEIPDSPGNYLICLKPGSKLPDSRTYEAIKFNSMDVVYTGIAGRSLRKRDFNQHFAGNNAGTSTLRKSIGSLFGYKKVPRDNNSSNGKTKFSMTDEVRLSNWMKENLVLYYFENSNPRQNEVKLINMYNPPLNLSNNKNEINIEYRRNLSKLRKTR